MFTFITGNQSKIYSAKQAFEKYKIEFKTKKLDLVEIQSSNQVEIIQSKLNQAFEILNEPVMVQDTSWSVPALRGFPGAYMHDMHGWLTESDFLRLMEVYEDKSILRYSHIGFKDQEKSHFLSVEAKGIFLSEPKGTGNYGVDRIISLRKDKLSIAECFDQDISVLDDAEEGVWEKFAKWYVEYSKLDK